MKGNFLVAIIGGMSLGAGLARTLAENEAEGVTIKDYHYKMLPSNFDIPHAAPRGKGKGDRIRRRQQWNRR